MFSLRSKKNLPGPTFIGIGAPRCGTTWLFENLKTHPEIWLPPIKELRHFTGRQGPQAKAKVIEKTLTAEDIKKNQDWLSRWRDTDPETTDWYRKLFANENNLISGDISPIYCTLPADKVRTVSDNFPEAKIIVMLRNPVERDWSHAKFKLHYQQGKPAPLPAEEYRAFLDSELCESRSAYAQIIQNWQNAYPAEQVFTGYYDQISEDPDQLLADICRFLGITYQEDFFSETARAKVHTSRGLLGDQTDTAAPEEILSYLAEKHLSGLEALETLTASPYVARWCRAIREKPANP